MLSNVFLHYVLDDWFERDVQPRLKGHSFLIRFADDFVMGFTREEDARRVMEVLPKRFEKYGLTIHPEKTRLVPFERPSDRPKRSETSARSPAGTFDLLGFTHYWGLSRRGYWVVKRKTSKSRLPSRTDGHRAMVPNESTPRADRTAPDTESEASRPLRVLRDHGQRGCVEPIPARCHRALEEMAWPTSSRRRSLLGADVSTAGAISAPAGDRRPLGVPSSSEGLKRGAVCVNCASTDLWGAWVGNHPGLPGGIRRSSFLPEKMNRHRITCIAISCIEFLS